MERDEEIIKASTDTFKENGDEFVKVVQLFWMSAFLSGAQWADKHPVDVWHEASEKPRTKEWILVQFEEDEYQTLALSEGGVDTWFNDWVDEYRAIRWAYIADLLPKGGEK